MNSTIPIRRLAQTPLSRKITRNRGMLSMFRCDQCREGKLKCTPIDRQWPAQCDRCSQRQLPCSEPKKAARKRKQSEKTEMLTDASSIQHHALHLEIESAFLTTHPTPSPVIDSAPPFLHQTSSPEINWAHTISHHTLSPESHVAISKIVILLKYLVNINLAQQKAANIHADFRRLLSDDSALNQGRIWTLKNMTTHISLIIADKADQLSGKIPEFQVLLLVNAMASEKPICNYCRAGRHAVLPTHTMDALAEAFRLEVPPLLQELATEDRFCSSCEHQVYQSDVTASFFTSGWYEEVTAILRKCGFSIIPPLVYWPDRILNDISLDVFSNLFDGSTEEEPFETFGRNILHMLLDLPGPAPSLKLGKVVNKSTAARYLRQCDCFGRTVLDIACMKGYVEIVRELLEYGDPPASKLDHGTSALHLAAAKGSLEICQMLMHLPGIDIDARAGSSQKTAKDYAISNGNDRVARFLSDYNTIGSPFYSRSDRLTWAIMQQSYHWAQMAVTRYKVDLNAALRLPHSRQPEGPLAAALTSGDYYMAEKIADLLVQHGAKINKPYSNGETALHRCAQKNNGAAASWLLGKGAWTSARNGNGMTALDLALLEDSVECVELLERYHTIASSLSHTEK